MGKLSPGRNAAAQMNKSYSARVSEGDENQLITGGSLMLLGIDEDWWRWSR